METPKKKPGFQYRNYWFSGFLIEKNMKKCSRCNEYKEYNQFNKHSSHKDGLSSSCKECEYIQRNTPEKKEKQRVLNKKYRDKNKEKSSIRHKAYRLNNLEKRKEQWKIYYKKNKTDIIQKQKKQKLENREDRLKKERLHRKNNKRKIGPNYNKNLKKKRLNDPIFRLKTNLRTRIWYIFKRGGHTKSKKSEELLGAPFKVVKGHIERQFSKGMSWDKVGKLIHIDHKIPLASAKTEEELISLCHYTNLQPLWAIDNIEKSNKIIPTQMIMTI